jgi:thioredoxin reductase (NADPH)
MKDPRSEPVWDCAIVGGGIAGLSAAIYLGRSRRRTVVIDSGHSMAQWEEMVDNYLGFPDGVGGRALLDRGRQQARLFGAILREDDIYKIRRHERDPFVVEGRQGEYQALRVLLATGLTHLLPEIPGAKACLGKSVFFCKDCDAFRVQERRIAVMGSRDEAVRYALGMLAFSSSVCLSTNGEPPAWSRRSQAWIEEYGIPVRCEPVVEVCHQAGAVHSLRFQSGEPYRIESLFVTRGDVFHTGLAEQLGAREDDDGQLLVDDDMRTTVSGLYAAGCVTPANCQMIIAAGQGATAAQAINRDLFEESLAHHALRVTMPAA